MKSHAVQVMGAAGASFDDPEHYIDKLAVVDDVGPRICWHVLVGYLENILQWSKSIIIPWELPGEVFILSLCHIEGGADGRTERIEM